MIKASLIYAAFTILLAIIDAIRIKVKWNKVANINHKVSTDLALYAGAITLAIWVVLNCKIGEWHWAYLAAFALVGLGCVCIRLMFYDICLNIFRIITKTNPTLRLDYQSPTTSSYIDQHTEKIDFWEKRILAVEAWLILFFIYHAIFKLW